MLLVSLVQAANVPPVISCSGYFVLGVVVGSLATLLALWSFGVIHPRRSSGGKAGC